MQTLRETSPDSDDAMETDDTQRQEIEKAFDLFTYGKLSRMGDSSSVRITLADLKRVARELREDLDENVLKLMMEEANGEGGKESVARGVSIEDFEAVMRRAGVFD